MMRQAYDDWMHELAGSDIPEHMHDGIALYLSDGIEPGSFLLSVLMNDLSGACSRADDINRDRLFDYVSFLWNEAPSAAWGSRDKVIEWTKEKVAQRNAERAETEPR